MTSVGLIIRPWGRSTDEILACAREADRHGLRIWIAGQMLPISADARLAAHEPLALAGAIAAATSVSRIGFMVFAAPYLPAAYLAKALATLDHLSGGRLDIGLGAGYDAREFAALDVEFAGIDARLAHLEATLDAIEQPVRPAVVPEPLQDPRPPVWIGGQGRRVGDVVARRADWANFAKGIAPDDFGLRAGRIADAAREAGRPPGSVRFSLTGTFLGARRDSPVVAARARARGTSADDYVDGLRAANAFVGTGAEIAGQLAPYAERGCASVALWPLEGDLATAAGALAEVAAAMR